MNTLPYVVSGDIHILLHEWACRRDFTLPGTPFFAAIRKRFNACLHEIFPNYEFVAEKELQTGMATLVRTGGLPTISLDRVYYRSRLTLDLTRIVDIHGQDAQIGPRPGCAPLAAQVEAIALHNHKTMALIDDVIFTGACIEEICGQLEKIGIAVPVVYAGIVVGNGARRIIQGGRTTRCVRWYNDVVDEVCERDFYPGVPLSGRTVSGEANTGMPYLLPFGNMGKWASIPEESQERLSRLCLQLTGELFMEIERLSGRIVRCCDLDRNVIGLPNDETRYIEALTECGLLAHA